MTHVIPQLKKKPMQNLNLHWSNSSTPNHEQIAKYYLYQLSGLAVNCTGTANQLQIHKDMHTQLSMKCQHNLKLEKFTFIIRLLLLVLLLLPMQCYVVGKAQPQQQHEVNYIGQADHGASILVKLSGSHSVLLQQ